MNLWELEGGIVYNHLPLHVSLLREQLVGGHRSNTSGDPTGSRLAPVRKRRTEGRPPSAGRAGRFHCIKRGTSLEAVSAVGVWELPCGQRHCHPKSSS